MYSRSGLRSDTLVRVRGGSQASPLKSEPSVCGEGEVNGEIILEPFEQVHNKSLVMRHFGATEEKRDAWAA